MAYKKCRVQCGHSVTFRSHVYYIRVFNPSVTGKLSSCLFSFLNLENTPWGKWLDKIPLWKAEALFEVIFWTAAKSGLNLVQWSENSGESKITSSTKCPAHVTIQNSTKLFGLVNLSIVTHVKNINRADEFCIYMYIKFFL